MSPGTVIRGSVLITTVLLAGYGGHAAKSDAILTGASQCVSFATVQQAVDNVYAREPGALNALLSGWGVK